MEITAKMVSDLRDKSGAPMMDCKRALVATSGDMEAAFDHLRKQGLKSADKRAGRATGEGRIAECLSSDGRRGVLVSLGCETDFVARGEEFNQLLSRMARLALETRAGSVEALLEQRLGQSNVQEEIKALGGKTGENLQLLKVALVECAGGRVGGYVHHDGKKAALIALETSAAPDATAALLKNLGMHVVSCRPQALRREDIAADVIEREKAVIRESEEVKKKPENLRESIVNGKLASFFSGAVLPEQPWVLDEKLSVAKAVQAALGVPAKIASFALVVVGS
jgi:elongation factor Ts